MSKITADNGDLNSGLLPECDAWLTHSMHSNVHNSPYFNHLGQNLTNLSQVKDSLSFTECATFSLRTGNKILLSLI